VRSYIIGEHKKQVIAMKLRSISGGSAYLRACLCHEGTEPFIQLNPE